MWGLLSGSALLIGAAIGWFVAMPRKVVAAIMAFGSGVLISALSFELMDEAWKQGGFVAVGIGFITGAFVYTGLNMARAARGARHRKRSELAARDEHAAVAPEGNSASLALGALIDGVPESIVIGTSLLAGGGIGWVAVAAVFLSNLPEGLSSAAARKEGKSATYTFTLWTGIALIAGVSSFAGYTLFDGASPQVLAGVQGVRGNARFCRARNENHLLHEQNLRQSHRLQAARGFGATDRQSCCRALPRADRRVDPGRLTIRGARTVRDC